MTTTGSAALSPADLDHIEMWLVLALAADDERCCATPETGVDDADAGPALDGGAPRAAALSIVDVDVDVRTTRRR